MRSTVNTSDLRAPNVERSERRIAFSFHRGSRSPGTWQEQDLRRRRPGTEPQRGGSSPGGKRGTAGAGGDGRSRPSADTASSRPAPPGSWRWSNGWHPGTPRNGAGTRRAGAGSRRPPEHHRKPQEMGEHVPPRHLGRILVCTRKRSENHEELLTVGAGSRRPVGGLESAAAEPPEKWKRKGGKREKRRKRAVRRPAGPGQRQP